MHIEEGGGGEVLRRLGAPFGADEQVSCHRGQPASYAGQHDQEGHTSCTDVLAAGVKISQFNLLLLWRKL